MALATPAPLLLLDVDGPLNPFRTLNPRTSQPSQRTPSHYTLHKMRPPGWEDEGREPLPVLLSPWHGDQLRALAERMTLVWATTWEAAANEWIAPVLGLPTDLPWIDFGDAKNAQRRIDGCDSWKTPLVASCIEAYTGRGVPWVWVDDELSRRDRHWLRQRLGPGHAKFLTMRIDAYEGLTAEHFNRIGDFCALVSGADVQVQPLPEVLRPDAERVVERSRMYSLEEVGERLGINEETRRRLGLPPLP